MQVRIDNELREGVNSATHDTDKDPFRAYVVVGGQYDETFTSLGENEVASLRLTNNRAAHTNLRNSSGTELGDASNPIRVDPTGSTAQPVSGSVTANAGTNLNTSALALETGGNLATIAGDTTSIDGKITACNTGAVVISSSALPTGAATETTLSTLNGKVSTCDTDDVRQSTHDNLNANANIQVSNSDVSDSNPVPTKVRRTTQVLTAINTTYDNTTTTATSASFDAREYRRGLFYAEVTESGTATDIEFTLQMSHDNSNWYDYRVGPWSLYIFDDATIATYGTLTIAEPFEICGGYLRLVVTATGTDASNTFTVADAYFEVID